MTRNIRNGDQQVLRRIDGGGIDPNAGGPPEESPLDDITIKLGEPPMENMPGPVIPQGNGGNGGNGGAGLSNNLPIVAPGPPQGGVPQMVQTQGTQNKNMKRPAGRLRLVKPGGTSWIKIRGIDGLS